MTPLHHLKRSLGTLLALGLILLVSLFVVRSLAGLGTQPTASPPENAGQASTVAGATNTAQGQDGAKPATPTLNSPTEIPVAAAGKRPPACTFPLADIKPVESQSVRYTFSEPKVVLASQTTLGVANWLPDGKHLLITRDLPNSARQSIEVLNMLSGETDKYAERDGSQKPLWLPGLQAVVYDAFVWSNEKSPSVERVELWMSRGPDSQPEKIASDIFSTSVSLDGNQVFFFSPSAGSMLQTWSVNTQKTQPVPLNME